jgi:hypothetical protein
VGVLLGLGPTSLKQPQPRPHPELPRRAARGVALLAQAQRFDQRLLRLGEAPLLDVEVADVGPRWRHESVDAMRKTEVGGREEVGPPL